MNRHGKRDKENHVINPWLMFDAGKMEKHELKTIQSIGAPTQSHFIEQRTPEAIRLGLPSFVWCVKGEVVWKDKFNVLIKGEG